LCHAALSQNPADARASHLLGRIALQLQHYNDAVRWIGGAAALMPGEVTYRVDLAAALALSGRPADAVPHLREAMRVRPEVPELHNNLGAVLEALGGVFCILKSTTARERLGSEVHFQLEVLPVGVVVQKAPWSGHLAGASRGLLLPRVTPIDTLRFGFQFAILIRQQCQAARQVGLASVSPCLPQVRCDLLTTDCGFTIHSQLRTREPSGAFSTRSVTRGFLHFRARRGRAM
jgi:hypothetical protein